MSESSAQGEIATPRFRCEDLKAVLWPEIKAAHEEITNMFEEERMETYELSQQVKRKRDT